ncbi:homoserine dehydrogenase [Actinoplanes xinjiangensis]|jgi:homoserine dehydrogenase|uniref:Homoserine dehydrogenase n=1 Tax=Actinoplanes xinjiangensis TaxID=512350 RepID=A0A316FQK7_9ACTN|nr:homoserine dehydrogenase [Actinoplanes xinjiangensis]PWK50525.1 homoserine dehydrogenase [Actinoplanes xinjiangensis]GIF36413.1 homoserine dehydrogenase [Actinoplanes xinjiangensis]
MSPAKSVRLALLGCGIVGSEVVRLLHEQRDDLTARIGAPLEIAGIAVRRPGRERGDLPVDPSLFTTDALGLVKRDDVDVVIEVVGGIEPARTWLTEALRAGKSVVTANKALLAEDGGALHDAAADGGADLYYEASVAGAIPLLRPLRESLHGDRVTAVTGIVNGTTNFILSSMASTGAGFNEALEEATELGYAEADPTADVEGFDAAAKAAILASLAFHTRVTAADVFREGMTGVTAGDMASAKEMGCTIKLLCIAQRTTDAVSVRVHPAMIPLTHPLASVGDAFNAVFVETEAAGPLMFYGRGAGGRPTASAVLGDIVAAARNRLTGARAPSESNYAELTVRPIGESLTRYHISLDVAEKPGVLATVAGVFAHHEVSIATVRQSGREDDAKLVIVTHSAPDAALAATVEALSRLDIVRSIASVLRVEGGAG